MATRKTISIRLTEPEFAKINAQCVKANMTIASFAKLAVLGLEVENPKQLLAEVNHLTAADILAQAVKTTPIFSNALALWVSRCTKTLNIILKLTSNMPFGDDSDLGKIYFRDFVVPSLREYVKELHELLINLEEDYNASKRS